MAIHIRPEQADDRSAIADVHIAAFPGPQEARLVDDLRAAGQLVVSYVAEEADQIVGHLAFSPVTLEEALDLTSGVGMAPVAVRPARQRQGIGAKLIDAGLDACRRSGFAFAVVLGDPAYYPRFGFTPAWQFGLHCRYTDGDAFMALEFVPAALAEVRGLVRYAPAFDALV